MNVENTRWRDGNGQRDPQVSSQSSLYMETCHSTFWCTDHILLCMLAHEAKFVENMWLVDNSAIHLLERPKQHASYS